MPCLPDVNKYLEFFFIMFTEDLKKSEWALDLIFGQSSVDRFIKTPLLLSLPVYNF